MKKGFYRSQVVEVEDNYGGVTFNVKSYYHLGFIDEQRVFSILTEGEGIPNWRLFEKEFDKLDNKGAITIENENTVEITFYNPFLKTREIFTGKKEGDKLYLKAHRENKPDEVFLDDVFEYIGTGE